MTDVTEDVTKPTKAKKTPEQKAAKRAAKQDKQDQLTKSQTVRYSFLTTNGTSVHLCEDGEFRSDEEMSKLGVED